MAPPSASDLMVINMGGLINKNGGVLLGVIVPEVLFEPFG